MTDSLVGFVSVTKASEGWTAYSDDDQADTVTAWARHMRNVTSVELRGVDCKQVRTYGGREKVWYWSAGARVLFGDGTHVDLPMFGTSPSNEDDVEIQKLLDAIAGR